MDIVNVRIDKKTKESARKALAGIGLDLSSGVKIFLNQVVIEKGLPFQPTKNPVILKAKWDAEVTVAKKGKHYKSAKALLADL